MADTTKKTPNPQGKGQVPVLAALFERQDSLAHVPPKQIEQVSTELFTSLFVLGSEFRFKPVVGKDYFLYRKPKKFWLSMLGPHEWNEETGGQFIGRCVLQDDMTWTMEMSEAAAADPAFTAYLDRARAEFDAALQAAETVDDVLPVFEQRFGFYRRIFAFGLAHSLGRSMVGSGIAGLSYDEARKQLTHDADAA